MKVNTWKDYVEFTRTTAVYPKEKELEYLLLGIIDEIGEFKLKLIDNTSQESLIDELGDVCWYVARITDNLNMVENMLFSLDDLDEEIDDEFLTLDFALRTTDNMIMEYCRLAGNMKKFIRDGNDSKMILAKENVLHLISYIIVIAKDLDSTIKDSILLNVDKLSDRKDRGKLKGDGDNR